MHRVFVAWDQAEARRFIALLQEHGISGRIIEDRNFPVRGEMHEVEASPEVWIADESLVPRALELASELEAKTRRADEPAEPPADESGPS